MTSDWTLFKQEMSNMFQHQREELLLSFAVHRKLKVFD